LQKETRSPKEIADIYDLEIKHVNRGCRRFCDIIDSNTLFYQIKSSQSSDFIERFAKRLNIDKQYINISKDVSNNIHKLDLASTHEPPSVAAGCLLLVITHYNLQLSKKQISDIFGISDVTISKTFRKIWPYHRIVLSNKITDLILENKNSIVKNTTGINKTNLIISNKDDSTVCSSETSDKQDIGDHLINEITEDNSSNFYTSDSDNESESDSESESDNIDIIKIIPVKSNTKKQTKNIDTVNKPTKRSQKSIIL
jgi:transcription initiation factor TFIIIB Brf1 subunit/transcription initiation factor TFIIB